MISPQRRSDLLDALRRGTVPQRSLDAFAVGLDRFEPTIDSELERARNGASGFKAIRGEYGSGKTFFVRWLQERAKRQGFATAEVQVSETETPLHRLETVYRRLMERLSTGSVASGAFKSIVDGWFYTLEEDVLASQPDLEQRPGQLTEAVTALMESRLGEVARQAPMFASALRGYRECLDANDLARAEGLLAWAAGQPNVAADAKRAAGIRGDVDHFGALSFLQGLLAMIKDSGQSGLVLVLDEVETLQRVRSDIRDKSLNALRQLMDEVDSGRFPGLYLVLTGTPAFFDGPQGIRRLPPLAQRLQTDFSADARFDNPRAPQIRLPNFDLGRLELLGTRIRDLYADGASDPTRIRSVADDAYISALAVALAGELGGKVGIAPRLFLRKLVAEVLDRVDQFDDFDPRRHYKLTLDGEHLAPEERHARGHESIDDIELDVDGGST